MSSGKIAKRVDSMTREMAARTNGSSGSAPPASARGLTLRKHDLDVAILYRTHGDTEPT
jgi:hypothetical protein